MAVKQKKLSPEANKNLRLWLEDVQYQDFKKDLKAFVKTENWPEIEDSFYGHLTVGTGGIRGPLGLGPNRINMRTIGEAAQGLSQFIWDFGEAAVQGGVVVGYEARKFSKEFAQMCCQVFAANGIKAYLFEHLCATPELSFAVRFLKTTAGVMITASHNPRTDNGFKFYWSDGGQVVPPHDAKFMELVSAVEKIKKISLSEGAGKNLFSLVGKKIDQAYLKAIKSLSLVSSRSAQVVYSPMHGAGSTNVLPVLQQEGFKVTVVKEQAEPNENFPTAHGDLINPEFREVIELAFKLGESLVADLAIVSDPDADRIGVAAKINLAKPELKFLTGNEVGACLTHFLLSELKIKGNLNKNSTVIETYVTTTLISDIAKSFGVKPIDHLLVGFKFIAEIIEKMSDKENFIFAAEESLGYLAGTFVRDKDAAIAASLLCELVSKLKDRGHSLVDYLDEIYKEFGYYKNISHYLELKGKAGKERIAVIMQGLRSKSPKILAGTKVLSYIDRLDTQKAKPENYVVGQTGDQLTFILNKDGRTRVTVRPSGTEPKLKFYIQHYAPVDKTRLDVVKSKIDQEAEGFKNSILQYCDNIL